jgi:hypothetical protein
MSCGGYGWEKRAHQAATRFRAIPFSALSPSHLASSALTPAERDLFVRALREPALGTVDAFVSHSWSDEPTAKYEALRIWADKFAQAHGRQPLLWLDKACIDRGDANTSLAYVPIYVRRMRTHFHGAPVRLGKASSRASPSTPCSTFDRALCPSASIACGCRRLRPLLQQCPLCSTTRMAFSNRPDRRSRLPPNYCSAHTRPHS